ncbi:transglycosylase SLT domain-containing protein [Rickettsia felis]|uniref:transglycosylase SLT domain-containing protein n=1 Tax=Rickettsia felis TaxID=42862 RepID=UPI000695009C|nr:transglycosylase SLT domain-containing protein [Rickettsia felis]
MNKIEIGQFLKMKNKVGIPNNNGMKMNILIRSEPLYLSSKRPVKIIEPIVLAITKKPIGKSFGTFNSRPSLFTKMFPLTKVTLEKDCTISGTPINVIKNTASAKYEKPCPELALGAKKKDIKVPADIPNQKIKFQILSLFNHFLALTWLKELLLTAIFPATTDLVKSCITSSSKCPDSYSLANICFNSKQIFLSAAIITMISVPNVSYSQGKINISKIISKAEQNYAIPTGLLAAIAEVESGLKPYAISISGKSVKTSSKEEAKQIIEQYLAKGITNIDIGIMQINWRWHAKEFDNNLDNMLSPSQNIIYAAQLLKSLHAKHQSWQKAVRYYHSAKDEYHRKYSKAVLVSWLKQQ